jgi:hypothetical protein
MTPMKMLLLIVGVFFFLASPVSAGTYWNPWMPPWACTAFEYAKKCNAERTPRFGHCRCIVR